MLSICSAISGEGIELSLIQPASAPVGRRSFTHDAIPRPLQTLAYRLDPGQMRIRRFAEHVFLKKLRQGSLAYLFPGASLATHEKIKERGHPLVLECINCHQETSKRILDDEFKRLGLPQRHDVTDARIQAEDRLLKHVDAIFAPSPQVRQSYVDAHFKGRILESSYGWDPERLSGTHRALPLCAGLTVLFVGSGCIRKGLHLLLEAWRRAEVQGRLVIAGQIDSQIRELCAPELARPDIVLLGQVADMGAVYRSADVFAFPTLEEGSPLVTYEAIGSGLAVVLSPMAAGEVVRDGIDGLVLQPHDVEGWVSALRTLATDVERRRNLAAAAAQRAQRYVWAEVGRRRRQQLLQLGKS